jgi:hypothetical protein
MSECTPDTPVVKTLWELDAAEQGKLASVFPRAKGVTQVAVGRSYKAGNRWVGLQGLNDLRFNHSANVTKFHKLKSTLAIVAEKLEAGPKSNLDAAITNAETALSKDGDPLDWAVTSKPSLTALKQAISASGAAVALGDSETRLATELETIADTIVADDAAHLEARKWAITRLPVFVYVDEYPELEGHQNIDEYLLSSCT